MSLKYIKLYINKYYAYFPIILILLVGLSFRLYGINWDAGFSYTPHPDERAIISKVNQIHFPPISIYGAREFFDPILSSWNPRWFPYGSFPIYLLKIIQIIHTYIFDNILYDLRLTGRFISAISDTITIAMIFLIGRKLYGYKIGLLASTLLAFSVIHIQLSHFYTVDTILTLFLTLSVYFILRTAQSISKINSIFIGIFTALALASKISLLPIFGVYLFSHLFYIFGVLQKFSSTDIRLYSKKRFWLSLKSAITTIIIFIITLLITQPYMFLDWQNFYEDILEQSQMVRRFIDYPYTRQYIDTPAFWYQIKQVSIWGLGLPLGIIGFLGLIYSIFEGLKKQHWLIYFIIGWTLPVSLLIYSTNTIIIILASTIALSSLLVTVPFRSNTSRKNVLILAWIIPIFLITGSFQVKFLRYFLPITPFIILLGSKLIIDIININSKYLNKIKFISYLFSLIIILTTLIYAISYLNIYSQPHTAVTSSKWINNNVPTNSIILKEHWEESLPGLENYKTIELPMYDPDTISKIALLSKRLAESDYLILYSNRLYGTINRLPERYPLSTAYYKLLFNEEIGYEFVNLETSYPSIFNINFQHNIFENLKLNVPELYKNTNQNKKYNINLVNADESFSVYDHPSVFILKNSKTLSQNEIKNLIISKSNNDKPELKTNSNTNQLLIEEKEFSKRVEHGSWSEYTRISSWTNTYPILAWLLILELISIVTLPISFIVFRNLPDRGYSITKTLGLLILCLIVWWFASLKLIMFTKVSVFLSIGLLFFIAIFITIKNSKNFIRFIKTQWKILIISEAIFLIAFIVFVIIRMANPDLWHPWRGGEKPMDLAYLNAILHSSYMPPIDPWYSGGFMNYYYWGHFITSVLIMGTGIISTTAYNLAIPLFFALVFSGSFSVVYNLCKLTINEEKDIRGKHSFYKFFLSPIFFGLICACFVTILGNLDGGIQLVNNLLNHASLSNSFDYWRSSRIMPSDTYGITEFPFFTFLFADLHAHLMSLPFTVLILFISIAIISDKKEEEVYLNLLSKYIPRFLQLTLLGISIGSLRVLNAWDFPTYLIIGCISILIAEYYHHGGFSLIIFLRTLFQSIYIFLIGYLAFIPFHLKYQTFFNSIENTPHTTEFWRLLVIFGLFIFIITSFYIQNSLSTIKNSYYLFKNKLIQIYYNLTKSSNNLEDNTNKNLQLTLILFSATFLGFFITYILTKEISSTTLFTSMIFLLALITLSKYKNYNPQMNFILIISMIALSLIIGLEFFRIEGDIDRMNSIFKFYLQIWVILAISSTYFLWIIVKNKKSFNTKFKLWILILLLLILTSAIYTIFGTKARIKDRFEFNPKTFTLDGTNFINYSIYNDPNESYIDLKLDFEGIEWMQKSIKGTPVILEAHTPSYRWGSRVSVYTGLPTIIGWKWHQEQQRWNYREDVLKRITDVDTLYNSTNIEEVISLINKYKINYIYIGKVEKIYYSEKGIAKFDQMSNLSLVFSNPEVKIFKTHLNAN